MPINESTIRLFISFSQPTNKQNFLSQLHSTTDYEKRRFKGDYKGDYKCII